jgi:phage FluMu protein Com
MGLGIHKDGSMTVYSLPLIGGEGDTKWKDNTWLIEHLRQLACKIDESHMQIVSIGTETINAIEPILHLIIKGYENYVQAYYETKDTPLTLIRAVDFNKLCSRKKWDIWEYILNVKWVCNKCNKAYATDGDSDYWDGKKPFRAGMNTVRCGYCGNVLTHRTNGGQSNPFEWTFVNKK